MKEKWCGKRDININSDNYWVINENVPTGDFSELTDAFVQFANEGYSIAEIAKSLGVCRTTVKKYLVRSRKRQDG